VKSGQVAQEKSVRQNFGETDAMLAELKLDPDVDREKKKEQRQGAEPAPDVEGRDIPGLAESKALANQDLADEKTAEDEEQLHAVESAVAEDAEDVAEVRIEHDEPVREDHAQDRRCAEEIESEDTLGLPMRRGGNRIRNAHGER